MSQFVVSARKYRPALFQDVIGQPHITTTLQNALRTNQLAHAFLFCGPHGVGKTTCARVLAKAINCLQLTEAVEPCNSCIHCEGFNSNRSMNIYELDAASHNSVEDIRELVDQVRYVPQMGKYKIYIIDEVHMLSSAAFNAFLKTLEEPPNYALFILATTERHKVLPTILSRCQIFNFNRIAYEEVVSQLQVIAKEEAMTYELAALQLIARKAAGAMRDALSMFDLIATAAGKDITITYQMVCDHLHVLDYDYYFQCTEAFLQGDVAALLSHYDAILRSGFQGNHFLVGLGEHLRNLLVCKDSTTIPLLEVPDFIRSRYATYAARCSMPFLLRSLTLVNQYDINYKASQHQRLHVELLLIELADGHDTGSTERGPTAGTALEKHGDQRLAVGQAQANASLLVKQKKETLTLPMLTQLQQDSGVVEEKQQSMVEQGTKDCLSIAAVQACWDAYREQLKRDGYRVGYYLMKQPITLQEKVITVSLVNPIQKDCLQNLKEPLVAYLCSKLHCVGLTIQGALVNQPQAEKAYTDQEKLIYLRKKNKAIALLCQRFGLEPVYV